MDVNLVILGISLIVIFGFFAEFIFKKLGIPDVLLLVFAGFTLRYYLPEGFVEQIAALSIVFTTFTLLFLMFEGALNIDLKSFAQGIVSGSSISFYNFIISAATITVILYVLGYQFLISMLIGCTLGGISSAFVMPLLKQLKPNGRVYTVLALESAITDVLTIVFALTVMRVIKINDFSFQAVLREFMSLFAVAGMIGLVAAAIWIFVDKKVFKEHRSFMSTIAVLMLIYYLTEYLGGNGAIAALVFGLILRNAHQLTSIIDSIINRSQETDKKSAIVITALTGEEHQFFSQIGFFLKTFFFVYIGLILDVTDQKAIIWGGTLALAILVVRNLSNLVTRSMTAEDRSLICSIFARGLAPAAVMQIVVLEKVITDMFLVNLTYIFIVSTIILSSIRIFIHRWKYPAQAQ